MTPSSATLRRASRAGRRRRRNAPAGGTGATARALAAGLWRQSSSTMNQRRTPCPCSRDQHQSSSSNMERATKWDHLDYDILLRDAAAATANWKKLHHYHHHHLPRSRSRSTIVALLESELDMARAQISELDEEKRATSKRLQRFLRKLEEEKSRMKENLRLERTHRRELEAANAKLLRELSEARRQALAYETERKARELMEEACSELTREVEEGQAELELLRRECLRMREEVEEERRMLQMAEVWREERVQMKLSDAKLALERKYSQLNRLMEAETAASSALLIRSPCRDDDAEKVDVDSVFEHFRRKEEQEEEEEEESPGPASSSSHNHLDSVSPATDLFLAKADNDNDPFSDDGSCSWLGVSDPWVSVPLPVAPPSNDASSHGGASSRRSGATKNTALIRRLWSTAITESRKKNGAQANGGSDQQKMTSRAVPLVAAAEQPAHRHRRHRQRGQQTEHSKQSLKEKLMEARMADHREKPPSYQKHYD